MPGPKKEVPTRGNYIGVTHLRDGRFHAVFRHAGSSVYAGTWASEEDAAIARDRAILHFDLASERGLNLPERARKLGAARPEELRREARLAHMKTRGSVSPYFGVAWTGRKWEARVPVGGKLRHVANFDDDRNAALAHDRAALYLGIETVLNFPGEATPAPIEEIRREARGLRKAGFSSKFRGVHWDAARGLWGARLHHAGQDHALGRFDSEEGAARAYDWAAWAALGREALLNFAAPPREPPPPVQKRSTPGPKLSKYQGVAHSRGDFSAQLCVSGETHHLGRWSEERDAAIAYDRAVLHFGLDRPLNLPEASERLGAMAPRALQNEARLRQRKLRGTAPYIGVIKMPGRSSWKAHVTDPNGGGVFVGTFDDPEAAAIAYDRVVLHLYGRDAVRNFSERKLKPATVDEMREHAHQLFKEQTTSQYRGVRLTRSGRWQSGIGHRGKMHYLGTFDVEEEAAEVYDKAAKRLHKKKAKLNFAES